MRKRALGGAAWDSMFLTFAKFLTLLFGIVLAKILSQGLSLEGYGTYSQANLVVSVVTSLCLFGLGDAVNFFYNKKDDKQAEEARMYIINTVFFIELVVGGICALATVLFRDAICIYFDNPLLSNILIVASLLPVFGNIIYFYQVMYISVGKAKMMAFYNLVLFLIKLVSAYIAVYVVKNILWIYIVLVLMDIMQVLVYKLTLRSNDVFVNPFKFSLKYIKPILAYSLPMGVYAMTSILTRDIDKLVIGRIAGTETLAIYTNCSKHLPFDFFVVSFATVLIPHIVRCVTEKNKEQSVTLFSSYMKIGYYSVWILGGAVLIAPAAVISFLYADAYVVGKTVFVLYVFDNMLRFASMHLVLTAAGKAKNLMAYSLVSLVLNVILNIILYYAMGMIGPAVATLIVALIYTLMVMEKTVKVLEVKWSEIFDVKDILAFLLSLIILWGVMKGLNTLLLFVGVHKYVAMMISMGIYGVSALLLHGKKIFHVMKIINQFKNAK